MVFGGIVASNGSRSAVHGCSGDVVLINSSSDGGEVVWCSIGANGVQLG